MSERGARNDGDWIETLLKRTGPRPGVPAYRAERVKQAVRSRWSDGIQRVARRRRLRRTAVLAAAAVVVAAVGLAVWSRGRPGLPAATAGRVERVAGTVSTGPGTSVRPGDEVAAGSVLTTGSDGRLAIRLGTGPSLRLDNGTRLKIVTESIHVLESGALYVDNPPGSEAAALEIRTPLGSIHETGTQFEVRWLGASLQLRVREGSVRFGGRRGAVDVGAGGELVVDATGGTRAGEMTGEGEPWRWIEEITPMMRIEGRSLLEFLQWAGRERGLGVRFAGMALEHSASRIVLKGSVEGHTMDQALASVLATCGLTYRIEGDTLYVEPVPAAEPRTPPAEGEGR